MRILRVRLRSGAGSVDAAQVAARLPRLLPEYAPLLVAHVSVATVTPDLIDLVVFLRPDLELPRDRVRRAVATWLLESPGASGWSLAGPDEWD